MDKGPPKVLPVQWRTATVDLVELRARAKKGDTGGDGSIPMVLSTESPVSRYFGTEILSHDSAAVDFSYATDGLPFLDDHSTSRQIGRLRNITLGADRQLRADAYPGNHPDAGWMFQDMRDGVRPHVSIGYRINEMVLQETGDQGDTYLVSKWTPLEGSTVPIPADVAAGVGRSVGPGGDRPAPVIVRVPDGAAPVPVTQRGHTMNPNDPTPGTSPAGGAPTPAPVAVSATAGVAGERTRITELAAIAVRAGRPELLTDWAAREGFTPDQAKAFLFDQARTAPAPTAPGHMDLSTRDARRYSINAAISAAVDGDWRRAGLEKEVSDTIGTRLQRGTKGFFIPLDIQTRASVTGQTAGTSSLGGASVATEIAPTMIELLRNRMMTRQLGATVMTGLTSNVAMVRQLTANTFAWTGENPSSANALGNLTMDQVTLTPRTGMASTALSRQLIVQSSVDANAMTERDIATIGALGVDLACLHGTGGSQPTGVFQTAGISTVTIAAHGGPPTWDVIVDLETQVATNNADVNVQAYLTNAKGRGKLKRTPKVSGQPIFIWETGGEMNGYRAEVSNQVKSDFAKGTSGSVCSGIAFGVWDELVIGEFGGAMEIVVDPFTYVGQNMIAVHGILMVDAVVKRPKAFAVVVDMTTT